MGQAPGSLGQAWLLGHRCPLAPAGPPGQQWGMDQEDRDFAEPGVRRPRPWSPLEVALLTAAIVIPIPILFILGFFALWAAFPDQ